MKNIIYILPFLFILAMLTTLVTAIMLKSETLGVISLLLGLGFIVSGLVLGNMPREETDEEN